MTTYKGLPDFQLDPLKVIHEVLSGYCQPCKGVEIKSGKVIDTKLSIEDGALKLEIQDPKPTVIVTYILKFSAVIDYIIMVGPKELRIKAVGWPEISIDLS